MTNHTSRIIDYEQSHQESVKCVVVGDTGVGKTRLICAKACNLILDYSQLMTTHIPSVWAIDQYRIHKEVLERSYELVDGVNISLRLWDTFGNHDKDRKFAYQRSDVVLLCFSVSNPLSLRNCKDVWYPEIRKFCPVAPIVLVGMKNDLRYMFRDEKFQNLCRERSPFFRPLKESDIVTPEEGRMVANQLHAPYYETSACTCYGIKETFENVIRAALIGRRQQKFWMTNLRHIRDYEIQEPFCPPKPARPQHQVPESNFAHEICSIGARQDYTDVELTDGVATLHCHKIILVAASDIFYTLFTNQPYENTGQTIESRNNHRRLSKCSSDLNIASSTCEAENNNKHRYFHDDSLLDLRKHNLKHIVSAHPILSLDTLRFLKHSFSKSNKLFSYAKLSDSKSKIKFIQEKLITFYRNVKNLRSNVPSESNRHSIVSFGNNIPLKTLADYIGVVHLMNHNVARIKTISMANVAKCLNYLDFVDFEAPKTPEELETKLRNYLGKHKCDVFTKRLAFFGLEKGLFSDVMFKLEDGLCLAHRCILMARCDVMAAMFSGDFKESNDKMVILPDVSRGSFHFMLHFLYTDELHPAVGHRNCMALIELANRFCLPRLIALVEDRVMNELLRMAEKNLETASISSRLLERCQMHNADQLADFCLWLLTIKFNELCANNARLLRSLHPENQAYLHRNRWPPIWFVKEYDYYLRCKRQLQWNQNPKSLKRYNNSGCFCFSSKSKGTRIDLVRDGPDQYNELSYKIITIL